MRKKETDIIIKGSLKKLADRGKAEVLKRFFKTRKGDYGEGDKFLGVTVPKQRKIAYEFKDISLAEVEKLLYGKFHEERMTALLILVVKFENGSKKERKNIFDLYKRNTKHINSWDLVDVSAPNILGEYLKDKDRKILYRYAVSRSLWERRIGIISTLAFIRNSDFQDALKISKILIGDKHDLIQKAVGWMLREVGKRSKNNLLELFLFNNRNIISRTTLRYSIEHFSNKKRKAYLNLPNTTKDDIIHR